MPSGAAEASNGNDQRARITREPKGPTDSATIPLVKVPKPEMKHGDAWLMTANVTSKPTAQKFLEVNQTPDYLCLQENKITNG